MAPKLRVTLAADIQEQASGVPSLLAQMPSIHVVAARLACVDYCLVSVSVSVGVPVLRATDARDSASLIATAARQLCEPLDIPYVRPGYRPTGWRRRALYESRLAKIREAKAAREAEARERAKKEGKDPDIAKPEPKAERNFTDPESKIHGVASRRSVKTGRWCVARTTC